LGVQGERKGRKAAKKALDLCVAGGGGKGLTVHKKRAPNIKTNRRKRFEKILEIGTPNGEGDTTRRARESFGLVWEMGRGEH